MMRRMKREKRKRRSMTLRMSRKIRIRPRVLTAMTRSRAVELKTVHQRPTDKPRGRAKKAAMRGRTRTTRNE